MQKAAAVHLGLYLSRRIVEAHGGELYVDSPPGEGNELTQRPSNELQKRPLICAITSTLAALAPGGNVSLPFCLGCVPYDLQITLYQLTVDEDCVGTLLCLQGGVDQHGVDAGTAITGGARHGLEDETVGRRPLPVQPLRLGRHERQHRHVAQAHDQRVGRSRLQEQDGPRAARVRLVQAADTPMSRRAPGQEWQRRAPDRGSASAPGLGLACQSGQDLRHRVHAILPLRGHRNEAGGEHEAQQRDHAPR